MDGTSAPKYTRTGYPRSRVAAAREAGALWYAGAPLLLSISADGGAVSRHILGNQLDLGQRPQAIVPPHAWQAAESQGHWSLTGCTVAPGFEFAGFEMAPEGWRPGQE